MKIRFPSEKIIDYSASAEEVQKIIAETKDIPVSNQVFVYQNQVISLDFIEKNKASKESIDLMIKVANQFIICGTLLEETAINLGYAPLIPPESLVKHRTLNNFKFKPRFYDINHIYSRKKKLQDRMTNRVKPFYEKYNTHKEERLKKIRAICENLATNTYVISTFNESYIPLFKNFIASCEKNGIDIRRKAIMFPMDNASYKACLELDVLAYFEEGAYGPTTSKHGGYGDNDFRICMFMKNAIIQDMMELGYDLLFQDIDMVWLNNPIPYLENIAHLKKYDFLFMFDGGNLRFQPLFYNSGFCYIKNNEYSRLSWQVIFDNYDKVWMYGSQQVPVNIVLNCYRERGLRTDLLDEYQFLNGHNIAPDNKKMENIKDNTYVVHVSWTGNLEFKLMKLKENGLWYL